ncbi:NUDIX hydrolase [Noviherbaspirillum sp. Root189]|uniref:NUDIX hydrolase n=1 Tax=Noviherbaspirillum sp. Root189 TaxID=1736487 RepID=UPI00070E2129|nr:NUDIX domain-containing protein [Noviherbaspirillum sp. Root189]KRB85097.1 hypothetical protein ASE07_21260 [Noviherbaspirillum sp. Root189]
MWLITPIGFFSVVQKPGDKQSGTLTVRASVKGDLTALKQHYLPGLCAIQESKDTDYRFRAQAPRAEVSAAMARLMEDLDYSNFKSEVAKRQGHKRSILYHDVRDVLYKLQTDPAFVEVEQAADSFGGVVISGGGKVLLREPTKHHGGYAWTFAKTRAKAGESPRDAAIRAVREKTGYEVRIRISVPGLFGSVSSSSNFYVMDAKHPPAKPNWQTNRMRWVSFNEARDLIRQSLNVEGRDRDLAILHAAEKVVGAIPYSEHPNVQPEDWYDLQVMPERHVVLYPKLRFTPEEMENIERGFYPTVMEQKWFIYFTGTRLRMHRSWTGILYFDVGFSFDNEGGAWVTDVIVNREVHSPDHEDSDEEDLKLLEDLIRYRLLEPLTEPAVDGMVKALTVATKPNYLGSPEVVSGLIKEIFDVVVRTLAKEADGKDFDAATAKIVSAFTNESSGYTCLPGWTSAQQMGSAIKKYMASMVLFDGDESLAEILTVGISVLTSKLQEILFDFFKDPMANWEKDALPQLNAVHQFVVAVLLGTNTLAYGEKVLEGFKWQSIRGNGSDEQLILEVGCEGGSLKVFGIQSNKLWRFRVEADESILIETLDGEVLCDSIEMNRPQYPRH